MSASSEIERIIIELEEQGADKAYVGIKRLDDVMRDISKHKGPSGIAESFEALTTLNDKLSNSLLDIPGLADKAAGAWSKLVGQIRAYNESQVNKAMRNVDLELARKDAQQLADQMRAANRIPTHLQSASSPKTIDYAAALATQSKKAGSAIEAASHSALEEAIAIGEAAQAASKLSSVYDIVEKRAKAAAKIDKDHLADQMRMANRIPTHLQSASGPKTLTGGQKAFQAFAKTFGPRATQGLVSTVETMEKIAPVVNMIGPPIATAAVAIGAVAIAGAGAALWAGKEFGGAVIKAQAYREDIETAFQTVERARMSQQNKEMHLGKSAAQLTAGALGSSKKLLSISNQIADDIGVSRDRVAGQTLDFTTKGFDPKEAKRAILSIADLGTIDQRAGTEGGREGLTKVMGKIKATGRINMDVLSELNTFGLEQGDVMAEIGKMLGKKDTDVIKMLSASGGIRGLDLEPIYRAIEKQTGGPAGMAAIAKADNNLSSLIERVKSIPSNVLFDMEAGPGMDGVKSGLRSVLNWFDVTKGKGKEVRQVAGDLFNAMVEGLTGNKIDASKGITGTLDAILAGAKEAVPAVKDMASGVRELVKGLAELSKYGTAIGVILGGNTGLNTPGARSGGVGGAYGGAAGGTTGATAINGDKNNMAMFDGGLAAGRNLHQGMVQGINSGNPPVAQASANLANTALTAVSTKWDAHSPAREFDKLARFAGDGTVRGFNRSESSVYSAAASMANAGLSGAWAVGQANSNGGAGMIAMAPSSGAGTVINFTANISVSGANSPSEAQAIGAAAVRGARAQFESHFGTGLRRLQYG